MMKFQYGQASTKNAVLQTVSEKNGSCDGWIEQKKILTSREAAETYIFCYEAVEALVAGFTCYCFLFLSVFFYELGGRIHKDGSRISEGTLKR